MAQSGVLRVPRVQLIRGLARTKKTANLSADSQQSLPQVSSTAGRHPGGELIPTRVKADSFPWCSRPITVAPLGLSESISSRPAWAGDATIRSVNAVPTHSTVCLNMAVLAAGNVRQQIGSEPDTPQQTSEARV